MNIRGFIRGGTVAAAVLAASLCFAPSAFAHVHVGIGIYVPGVSIGVGNCWRCGYWAPAPVYYPSVYPAPVYYPPVYYSPGPVYYGYGYYVPRYRYYPRHYRRGWHRGWHDHDGYYRHHDDDDGD